MRSRSDTWKSVVASGDFQMETVVRIYGAQGEDPDAVAGFDSYGTYKEYSKITAPVITRNLLVGDKISVGNCTIGTLNFSVLTQDTIPKSAKIVVCSRPYLEDVYAEWMDFGTFWIDERTVVDDLITITAYDSMKMGYQVYSDDSITRNWPKAIKTVVTRIAEQMNVAIDSRTIAQIIDSPIGENVIVLKPNDNDNLLDILGRIGGVIGGNWTITFDNKLRYIAISSIPENTNYIIDNQTEYNYVSTESGNAIVWADGDDGTQDYGDIDVFAVPIVIGSLNTSRQYSISKVTMSFDDEHVYSYGNNTGFELLIENNPYATPGLCKALYNTASGVVYAPFNIESACYDPAAEIGDGLVINMQEPVSSILFNEVRTFDVTFRADASAPGEDETESEYPYKTAWQRMKYEIEDATVQLGRELRSVISQTQTEIMQTVSDTYTTREDSDLVELVTNSKISQRADSIILTVQRHFTTKNETGTVKNELESTIEQTAGQIKLDVKQTTDELAGRISTAESTLELIPGQIAAKVSKDNVIGQFLLNIQQDAESDAWNSVATLTADKINLKGYVTFSNLQTAGQTTINGANVQTGTITATQLSSNVNSSISSAQSTANGANAREQYIYISKPTGTTSVGANTTWVSDATGNQNTWTIKRPVYNKSYPVLFIAKQSQTVSQKNAGSTCACTTPAIDQTTTVIDGGNIVTGSITAGSIAGHTITTDKLTGSIANSGWGIDFQNGTFTIGNISANNITSGTISADRIGAISKDKITGSIGSDGWGIDFTNGTFTIGNISASNITAGTLNADKMTIQCGDPELISGGSGITIKNGEIVIRHTDNGSSYSTFGYINTGRALGLGSIGGHYFVSLSSGRWLYLSANQNMVLSCRNLYLTDETKTIWYKGYDGLVDGHNCINGIICDAV